MNKLAILMIAAAMLTGTETLTAQQASNGEYPAQVSEGQVALEVRPAWSEGRMVVEISANTHSVDLSSLDLSESVRLVLDGKEYAPVEAGSLAGHHARTTLGFEVPARPTAFQLRIRDVPDVPVRTFTWPTDG